MIFKWILILFLTSSVIITILSIIRLYKKKDSKVSIGELIVILCTSVLAFIESRFMWNERKNEKKSPNQKN
jgi:quinol-cytochrome oxidoreductase complex cytochrome b subunit